MGRWRRDAPADGRDVRPRRAQWLQNKAVGTLLALLLLVLVAVCLQIRDHPQISPIDEMVHADYMVKVANGQLPRVGSFVGDEMLREDACRRAEIPNFQAPPCTAAVLRPEQFVSQSGGYNYEVGQQPPTYYLVTGLAARLLVTISPIHSIVSAARVVGVFWLAGGVVVLWFALAELSITPGARLIATAPVVITPVILDVHAFVNSDATAILAGAALLWATLRWERARGPAWVVLAIAALAGATKVTNLLGIGAMAMYLVVRAINKNPTSSASAQQPARGRWAAIALACSMLVVGLAVEAIWFMVAAVRAIRGHPPNPTDALFHVDHLELGHVLGQVGATLSPVGNPPFVYPFVGHQLFITLAFALNLLVIGSCVAGVAASPAGSRRETLGLSALAAMGATGPAIAVLTYLTIHAVFPVPGRYGLVLVPILIGMLAALLDKRVVRVLVGGFSASTVVLTLARLLAG